MPLPLPDRVSLAELLNLAKLRIDKDEADRLEADLTRILGFFRSLRDFDTDGVPPSPYAVDVENVDRPDGPIPDPAQPLVRGRRLVDEHAPERAEGGYRVPRVID